MGLFRIASELTLHSRPTRSFDSHSRSGVLGVLIQIYYPSLPSLDQLHTQTHSTVGRTPQSCLKTLRSLITAVNRNAIVMNWEYTGGGIPLAQLSPIWVRLIFLEGFTNLSNFVSGPQPPHPSSPLIERRTTDMIIKLNRSFHSFSLSFSPRVIHPFLD